MVKNIEQVKEMWLYAKPLMESDLDINLDYSISSMIELEKCLHVLKNVPTDHSYSVLLFGFYLGETIVSNYEKAEWFIEFHKQDNILDYNVLIKTEPHGVGVDVYELMAALFNKKNIPPIEQLFSSLNKALEQLDVKKKVKTISTGEPSTLGTYRKIAKILSGSSNSRIVKYFDKRIANAQNGEKEIIHDDEERMMYVIGKTVYEEKTSSKQYM